MACVDVGVEVHIQKHHMRPEALHSADQRLWRGYDLYFCELIRSQSNADLT